ncbi:MAG: hypothetical protein HYS08_01820 [Chlamydiae bacterium]|nr:hypothetical protein [Chlamydiota bacterium]MBI3266821.1 hypothetical protein [Chlamydiota bacterium]
MEKVYEYKIELRSLDLLHCPTCRLELRRIFLMDPFLQGLICEKQHRFFVELKAPLSVETAKSSLIEAPPNKNRNDLEIIKRWLGQIQYRSKLNNQLATILRRIHDISVEGLHISYDYSIFQYCPICADGLRNFDHENSWTQGLRCSRGHEYGARNGIGFILEKQHIQLQEEMEDKMLFSLIDGWLRKDTLVKEQLHQEIELVLSNFICKNEKEQGKVV